jgi:outer membrane murein-binding lipoprotein Lpp
LAGFIGGEYLTGLRYKLIAFFLIGGFVLGSIFSLINASNKITELSVEINQLQTQLQQCKNTNQQLINQIQIQQEEYNKARQILKEAYNRPPKRVYVKQVVKQPVYITNQDCQQMADLVKQAQEQLQ